MNTAQLLKISGYKDKPVPNLFFKQDTETKHLAILFPGAGYISRMPVLYYPTQLMLSKQADVLRVDYSYLNPEYESLDKREQEEWFDRDVVASFEIALRQRHYEKVTLIGKSLGTLALGVLLPKTDAKITQCVWLTPLLKIDWLVQRIRDNQRSSLFVIGTRDDHYNADRLEDVKSVTQGTSLVVDGADHSLEIAGDVLKSISIQAQVVRMIEDFIEGETK